MKNKQKNVSVDIECDGLIIGRHNMISFGAVIIENGLKRTFYREIKPLTNDYNPESLAISGFTREQTINFSSALQAMLDFDLWLKENIDGKPIFWADNNGFDFAWINYYFLSLLGYNPFGHSSRRISDFICGLEKDLRFKWKHLRKTKHTHIAIEDAIANAEVLLQYFEKFNIK